MAPVRAALVRWTGRGSATRLKRGVSAILKEEGVKADVHLVGGSVVVSGPEPAGTAELLCSVPGVSWVAAGFEVKRFSDVSEAAARLARAVLRPGKRFSVVAEATGEKSASDLTGMVIGAMLETGRGGRVGDRDLDARFRAAWDGTRGVIGLELREGPGGVTTGDEEVSCLVSGGRHSAVVAWMAMLSGYRVNLVHAKEGEDSLLAVARLYSELSHRAEPGATRLEVLDGRGAQKALAKAASGRAFGGFHPGRARPDFLAGVDAPLFLLPDEKVDTEARRLGFEPLETKAAWSPRDGPARMMVFDGARASVSDVLDGLRRTPLR